MNILTLKNFYKENKIFSLQLMIIFFVMFNLSSLPIILKDISTEFNISPNQAVGIIYYFMIGYFSGALYYTLNPHNFTLKKIFYVYVPMLFSLNVLIGFNYSFLVFKILRFFVGFFSSAMVPFALNYFSEIKKEKGRFVGTVFSATTISGISGVIITSFVNWRYIFFIPAISFIVIFLYIVFFVNKDILNEDVQFNNKKNSLSFFAAFTDSRINFIYFYILFLTIIRASIATWLGNYLMLQHHFSKNIIGIIYLIISLSTVLGSMTSGIYLNRYKHKRLVLIFGAFFLLFFTLFFFVDNFFITGFILISGLFGFSRQGLHVIFVTLLSSSNNETKSQSLGINSIIVFLGNTIGAVFISKGTVLYRFEQIVFFLMIIYLGIYLSFLPNKNLIYKYSIK